MNALSSEVAAPSTAEPAAETSTEPAAADAPAPREGGARRCRGGERAAAVARERDHLREVLSALMMCSMHEKISAS